MFTNKIIIKKITFSLTGDTSFSKIVKKNVIITMQLPFTFLKFDFCVDIKILVLDNDRLRIIEIPAKFAATLNSGSPTSAMVGQMVSGPMNFRRNPMTPLKPITIWNSDETIMAPCS